MYNGVVERCVDVLSDPLRFVNGDQVPCELDTSRKAPTRVPEIPLYPAVQDMSRFVQTTRV